LQVDAAGEFRSPENEEESPWVTSFQWLRGQDLNGEAMLTTGDVPADGGGY
jgi:hypothetical protein